jgi:hypothetical protein
VIASVIPPGNAVATRSNAIAAAAIGKPTAHHATRKGQQRPSYRSLPASMVSVNRVACTGRLEDAGGERGLAFAARETDPRRDRVQVEIPVRGRHAVAWRKIEQQRQQTG